MRIHYVTLLVFVMALLPRIEDANLSADARIFSDMRDYLAVAVNFVEGRGLIGNGNERVLAYRPPFYPLVIGLFFKAGLPSVKAFYFAQAVIGSVSCSLATYLTFLFVRRLKPLESLNLSRSFIEILIPFLVGLSLAFYDSHIFFTGVLMTETLFTFLLLLWLIVLLRLHEQTSLVNIILAGTLLALLALTRPGSLFYLPALLLVLWILPLPQKRRLAWMAIGVGAMILVITPWTIRNAVLLSAFVPITTNGGVNFYIGHNDKFGYSSADKQDIRENTDLNEVEESAYFMKLGQDYIREHPMEDMKNNLIKLHHLYTIDFKPFPWDSGREFFSLPDNRMEYAFIYPWFFGPRHHILVRQTLCENSHRRRYFSYVKLHGILWQNPISCALGALDSDGILAGDNGCDCFCL